MLHFYQTGSNELLFVGHFLSGLLLLVGSHKVVCLVPPYSYYINDLPDCTQSYAGIFADDTKPYRPICSPDDSLTLQNDIYSVLQWCNTWLSFLNFPKCHYNTIGCSSSSTEYHFPSENEANIISMVTEGVLYLIRI